MGYINPPVYNRLATDPGLENLLYQQQQIQNGSGDFPLQVDGLTYSGGWRNFVAPSANLRIIGGNGYTVTLEDDQGVQYPGVDSSRVIRRRNF